MTGEQYTGERVTVDASEFKREMHNYIRWMLATCVTCVIVVGGAMFTNAQWQARTEEQVKNYGQRLDTHDEEIRNLHTFQGQINGRLGVIEERTQNTVDGIKRIESKMDAKK